MRNFYLIFCLLLASLSLLSLAHEAPNAPKKQFQESPDKLIAGNENKAPEIDILSERLIIHHNEHLAIFEQDVIVTFDTIKLYTNRLEIYYTPGESQGLKNPSDQQAFGKNIRKIVIPNQVRAQKIDENAVMIASSAEFDNETKILTLIGDVLLYKDGYILSTDKLTYRSNLSSIRSKK